MKYLKFDFSEKETVCDHCNQPNINRQIPVVYYFKCGHKFHESTTCMPSLKANMKENLSCHKCLPKLDYI